MNKNIISIVNGIEIVTVEQGGEIFVPIKPICEALNVGVESQFDKIQADEILNSVAVFCTATGSDGKQYEMRCLPLRYTYGWIFTINPKKVGADAKDSVTQYRRECYDALYDHFTLAEKAEGAERCRATYLGPEGCRTRCDCLS